jgi:HD-GYP domain-containing protein (c-di-GMP phosphodiesterase class II)
MKLRIEQIYLADIVESALLDLDIELTDQQWQIIQEHTAQLEQALRAAGSAE